MLTRTLSVRARVTDEDTLSSVRSKPATEAVSDVGCSGKLTHREDER